MSELPRPPAPSSEFPAAFPDATTAAASGTTPATGRGPHGADGRRPASAVQLATVAGTVGALVGFSLGVFVGAAGGRREATTAAAPAPEAKRPVVETAPAQAAALRLDVGSSEDAPKLGGAFRPHEAIDGRSVALVGKESASVALALPSAAGSYLSFVARAMGTEPGKPLEFTAGVPGNAVATLHVTDHFELVGVPLPAAAAGSAIAIALAGDPAKDAALAVDRVDVEPLSDRVHWDLSQPAHRARLLTGFYEPEGVGTPDATVWSAGLRSTVGVVLAPAHGDYELVLDGRGFDASAPTDVAVMINDQSVGTAKLSAAPADVSLTVPEVVLRTGANEIAFGYPKTFRPSRLVPGSKDERELAVNLHGFDLRPK